MRIKSLNIQAKADQAIIWQDELYLLDQRVLPHQIQFIACQNADETAQAIRSMVVRGAPAIGITAAYGVVLAARQAWLSAGSNWPEQIQADLNRLRAARPTAVNLGWALDRMSHLIEQLPNHKNPEPALADEAQKIHAEDRAINQRMAQLGADLIQGEAVSVLTHCNAGALATGGYGTALGVIRRLYEQNRLKRAYADETRPWLQGSRLTAWELAQEGIPTCVLADQAAASLMRSGAIDWVIVGADRVAVNGDVANKIGTYGLALAAKAHGVGFMVVAPSSTLDQHCPNGDHIPIENRSADEILKCANQPIAAAGCSAWNPVFDITPAQWIDVLVTEKGVIEQPDASKIRALF